MKIVVIAVASYASDNYFLKQKKQSYYVWIWCVSMMEFIFKQNLSKQYLALQGLHASPSFSVLIPEIFISDITTYLSGLILGKFTWLNRIFQRQEIFTIGKYRLSLNVNSVVNYYIGLFLVYSCVW